MQLAQFFEKGKICIGIGETSIRQTQAYDLILLINSITEAIALGIKFVNPVQPQPRLRKDFILLPIPEKCLDIKGQEG